MTRLLGYLMVVAFFLLPVSTVAARSLDGPASEKVSPGVGLQAKRIDQVDNPDRNDKMLHLTPDNEGNFSEQANSHEMSLMIGLFARHVDQSDNPNEDLRMVVLSYDNYIVSRYINTWDDPTYFGGKRFSTNKYSIHENRNFFYQGNLYLGILYGYGNNAAINIKGLAPAVFPTIGVGYKTTSVEMGYVPTPSGGVFLSLFKYQF